VLGLTSGLYREEKDLTMNARETSVWAQGRLEVTSTTTTICGDGEDGRDVR
jgi:hypothetical protein